MADIIIGRTEKDLQKYGTEGTIYVGKQYIKMGESMSLGNKVLMDVIRPHVILVCGKRGEGKCLDGATPIILADGSIKTIKELAENKEEILSLDNSLKIRSAPKREFYMRIADQLLELTLRTGKTITLTPEHPLLTIKGWENACNLSLGSRIATPRVLPVFGSEKLEDCKVKLLAYLIAEGHLSNGFVLFSNTEKALITDFCNSIKDFDANLKIKSHGSSNFRIIENRKKEVVAPVRGANSAFAKGNKLESRSSIRKWLEELGAYGKLSTEKFVPEIIFKLPKHKIALFLNRLFSCDGTIYPRGESWDAAYSSSSILLARQVQHLLLRFGVVSTVKARETYRNPNYELIIRGEHLLTLINEIGFFGAKEIKQTQALKKLNSVKRNPNTDTVPKEIWDLYKPSNWAELGRKMNYSTPKGMRSSINYSPSRQKLLQMAEIENSSMLRELAESDIYWDEIIGIKELNGNFEVYDISVPDYHNFVAGDIIVHNSYTLAMVAEGISDLPKEISQNLASLYLDTMGIFWTMKRPNYREEALLNNWELKPKGLENVRVFVPGGKFDEMLEQGIPVDDKFYLTTSELSPEEWAYAMGVDAVSAQGILISRIINRLKKSEKTDYDIDDIIKNIDSAEETDNLTKYAVKSRFMAVQEWGLFARKGTEISEIIKGGQAAVLDVSVYSHVYGAFSIRALVIGIFAKKVLEHRMAVRKIEEKEEIDEGFSYFRKREVKKKKVPMVWMFIDEIHEFLPAEGSTLATGPLLQLIREGRQPGVSMVVATQQAGKMNSDVLSQCDLVISHRVTAKEDIDALNKIMQSYMTSTIGNLLDSMPRIKGTALVLDQNQERLYSIQVRPRFSWHGGETPTAIPPKSREF